MSYYQIELQKIAEQAAARKIDSTRHKCFVSYHAADAGEVATFLDKFGTEFVAKTIGVTDEDDFIDSENTDYIMDQIRTKYLGYSTVTIVLVGKCTWPVDTWTGRCTRHCATASTARSTACSRSSFQARRG